jgi:hypothetical protein
MSSEKTTTDAAPVFQVNQKKLKELAESASSIKIGGKVSLWFFFYLIIKKQIC